MDVSILIPLFNRLDLTRACLESLESTAGDLRYEVILTDDGSTDGTRDFLRSLRPPRYRVVLNDRPRGYAANNNHAARLARAPVLCLLNNDTVLMPAWLHAMLRVLRRTPDSGFVGNVQREPFSGLIDHIGVTFNPDGTPVHAGKNDSAPPEQEFGRWPAVTAACCVISKDVFMKLGGFDEGFQNGFEDIDFCLRAAEAGHRHYVANRSSIYHYISASPGRRRHEDSNLERYRARWGARYLAFVARREEQRKAWQHDHVYSRENETVWREQWELNRDARRQHRQDLLDARVDARRYLRKHLWRPWRYNFGRVCRALVQVSHPLPAPIGPPPRIVAYEFAQNGSGPFPGRDAVLFDPPRR